MPMADLIEMTPAGGETGSRNQTLGALLWLAVRQGGLPLKVFDSSTGFLCRMDRSAAPTPACASGSLAGPQ